MSMTDRPGFDESEWQAQERGMRAAPGGDAGGMDAATAHYRVVAGALRSLPLGEPPVDFAAGVAGRIARHDAGLERAMARILSVVLVVASIVVGVRYGGPWLQSLHQGFGGEASGWMLAGMGCVVLSWICNLLARWRPLAVSTRRQLDR